MIKRIFDLLHFLSFSLILIPIRDKEQMRGKRLSYRLFAKNFCISLLEISITA
jgi:hypothetical protein